MEIASFLGVLTAGAGVCTRWIGVSAGVLGYSQRKTLLLRNLMTKGAWKRAHAIKLQLACRHAFGVRLDEREIRWALSQPDPLAYFERRALAEPFVRFDPMTSTLISARGIPGLPHASLARILSLLSPGVLLYMLFLTGLSSAEGLVPFLLALGFTAVMFTLLVYTGAKIEAAALLLNRDSESVSETFATPIAPSTEA